MGSQRGGHNWATFTFTRVSHKIKWLRICIYYHSFPGGSDSKESAYNAGDPGSIPGSGRYPREGNGNPLQHSCPKNSMDRGIWWAIVHGVAKLLRHNWATITFFHHDYKTENLQRKARGSVTKGRVVVSSSGEGKACGLKGAQKAYWESTWWLYKVCSVIIV